MIKFGFVGFLCFFIDWGIMVFLTEVFGINPLISSTISFTVSVTVNYILSVTFVFETDKNANKGSQFVIFVLLSIVGLGVNELAAFIGIFIGLMRSFRQSVKQVRKWKTGGWKNVRCM